MSANLRTLIAYADINHTEQTRNEVLNRNWFWENHRETVLNGRQRQMVEALKDVLVS